MRETGERPGRASLEGQASPDVEQGSDGLPPRRGFRL